MFKIIPNKREIGAEIVCNINKLNKKDRKRKLNIPIQVLWGKKGVIEKQFKPIKIWQKYSKQKVTGFAINSGHFIPEENPKETINQLKKFFLKYV